jgi:hypothetical protein
MMIPCEKMRYSKRRIVIDSENGSANRSVTPFVFCCEDHEQHGQRFVVGLFGSALIYFALPTSRCIGLRTDHRSMVFHTPGQTRSEYWNVTYDFRGQEHSMHMTVTPGATVTPW